MAASPNITLRGILSQSKPRVRRKTKSSKNSRGDWPEFPADTIAIWDDFNLDNLNESYGHVLDLDIPEQRPAPPNPHQVLTGIEVAKPDDIKHLIKWNYEVIDATLDFARKHLNLHNSVLLRHQTSTLERSAIARVSDGRKTVKVDHLIALDEYPQANLVIGLGKPSSKFQGRKVADHPGHVSREGLQPLRQLADQCDIAKTRYGYIQTEEDFVACCLSRDASESWKVAVMPIPWSKHGENQLTTDLALWWLSMLAMAGPQHRKIVGERR